MYYLPLNHVSYVHAHISKDPLGKTFNIERLSFVTFARECVRVECDNTSGNVLTSIFDCVEVELPALYIVHFTRDLLL